MHAVDHQALARGSWLERMPAGWKFLVMVVVIVGVAMMPRDRAMWLMVPAGLLIGLVVAAGLPVVALVKRLLLLEPFVLGAALLALFSPVPERVDFFLFLIARGTVALLAMLVFSSTTAFTEMLQLFRRLRMPYLLVTTLALMHRYLFVLGEESGRMKRARASRTFVRGRGAAWRMGSTIVAQLFLRASMRADRIYAAMCARGWGADSSPKKGN